MPSKTDELRRAIRQVEQDSQPHQSATGNSKKLTSKAAQLQQDDKYQQMQGQNQRLTAELNGLKQQRSVDESCTHHSVPQSEGEEGTNTLVEGTTWLTGNTASTCCPTHSTSYARFEGIVKGCYCGAICCVGGQLKLTNVEKYVCVNLC